MFMKTADSHWGWVDVEVLASYKDVNLFYRVAKNRLENYNPEGEATTRARGEDGR